MTRDEFLQCMDEGLLFAAVQADHTILDDNEMRQHLNKVGFENQKRSIIDMLGYYDPDVFIDPIPRSDLKK